MGSFIEINDSLAITSEQGFPAELDYNQHLKDPYSLDDFQDKEFSFQGKPGIRIYKVPPIRNFLYQVIDDQNWIFWGQVHITQITQDYINGTTAGRFKIIYLNTPEQMLKHFVLGGVSVADKDFFRNRQMQ